MDTTMQVAVGTTTATTGSSGGSSDNIAANVARTNAAAVTTTTTTNITDISKLRDSIPLATPYPWEGDDDGLTHIDLVRSQKKSNDRLQQQKMKSFGGSGVRMPFNVAGVGAGTGIIALHEMAFSSTSTVSAPAKLLLLDLLKEHNLPTPKFEGDGDDDVEDDDNDTTDVIIEDDDDDDDEDNDDDDSSGDEPRRIRTKVVSGKSRKKSKTIQHANITTTVMKTYNGSHIVDGDDANDGKIINKHAIDLSNIASLSSTFPDSKTIEQAREGKLSLFLSLLKVIDEQQQQKQTKGENTDNNNPSAAETGGDSGTTAATIDNSNNGSGGYSGGATPVPTKQLIRTCALTIQPDIVPGILDAKEVVMAALVFLSSTFEPTSNTKSIESESNDNDNNNDQNSSSDSSKLSLPLLRATNETTGDLERRNYIKAKDYNLSDVEFQKSVLRLENVFFTTTTGNPQWISRKKYIPIIGDDNNTGNTISLLTPKEEASFYLKGNIPASIIGRKKGEGTRKRRAATPTQGVGGGGGGGSGSGAAATTAVSKATAAAASAAKSTTIPTTTSAVTSQSKSLGKVIPTAPPVLSSPVVKKAKKGASTSETTTTNMILGGSNSNNKTVSAFDTTAATADDIMEDDDDDDEVVEATVLVDDNDDDDEDDGNNNDNNYGNGNNNDDDDSDNSSAPSHSF